MPGFDEHLVDRNGDGFVDDAQVRFSISLTGEDGSPEFWRRLIDLASRIGMEAQALPLPLFVVDREPKAGDDRPIVTIRTLDDIARYEAPIEITGADRPELLDAAVEQSGCLLGLFGIGGMLADHDGDLLPDATRVTFDLPDTLPVEVGVALANLAARIGLETGGVTLPLSAEGRRPLRVRIIDGDAKLAINGAGWTVSGGAGPAARLLDRVSAEWPYYGHPDTPGAAYGVGWLGRALAGDAPGRYRDDRRAQADIRWELQWSARPETSRLLEAVDRTLVPRLTPDEPVELVAYACEPPSARRRLEQAIQSRVEAAGVVECDVTVLCAYKVGLSWLREVVLPALQGREVSRLAITYRRFEPPTGQEHLDMPIRWLQEMFPGNEIAARELQMPLDAIALDESTDPGGPVYRAEASGLDGERIGEWSCDLLWRTMPFLRHAPDEGMVAVTTGGFIARIGSETLRVPVETDLERFWEFWQRETLGRVVRDIEASGGFRAGRQPFFGALEAEVWISSPNGRLGIREENDSAAEGLHEDIYFNTLDTIETLGLRSSGGKTSAPGAVVPIVHVQPGVTPHAVVRLRGAPDPPSAPVELRVTALEIVDGELAARLEPRDGEWPDDLDSRLDDVSRLADGWDRSFPAVLTAGDVERRLRLPLPAILDHAEPVDQAPPMDVNIHGESVVEWAGALGSAPEVSAWVEDYSYQGRPIVGMAIRSAAPGRVWSPVKLALLKPTALIVARHHANEISSTNAAFQLAHLCSTDPAWAALLSRINIVMLPYENADGAALHARLAAAPEAEIWKHHPARYNALGHEFGEDFFKPHTPFGEARARPAIWRRWLPDAIVDNHGVPSHEWVQPFAGFGSPPRFHVSYWIPQALIYGIAFHVHDERYPEHERAALALRDAVSSAIRETDIGDLNREIGASYRLWGQSREPDRFPGVFHDDMLWHIGPREVDPDGRGFNIRYPGTTMLSWVTEVNDETATGRHLERVARAHLLANRAMLDLLAAAAPGVVERTATESAGRTILRVGRRRPLDLSSRS